MWGNNSDNTALSADPANGGIGYQPWTSTEVGGVEAGYFTGNSTQFGGGNVNSSDNLSWALYGSKVGNSSARAYRKLINPLEVGSSFRVKIAIRFRNGFKGAGFFANGANIFMFQAATDQYQYSTNGGTSWTNLGWDYGTGESIFDVAAFRTGSNTHDFVVTQVNTAASVTVPVTNANVVDELHLFVGNTDGTGNDNLYVNFISAFNPFRLL